MADVHQALADVVRLQREADGEGNRRESGGGHRAGEIADEDEFPTPREALPGHAGAPVGQRQRHEGEHFRKEVEAEEDRADADREQERPDQEVAGVDGGGHRERGSSLLGGIDPIVGKRIPI